ncbi:BppU family phage baseplate upper protein [Bacillus atrophaeus]|uniref:BppU family phage baseplate upper protein n=1 Tax=Bacillus atrophaeus TaxID=1452 RepID=UPI00032EEC08|nr:BppU family phage baseplate upper protein [Bacillus atrophaeus]AKL83290.1 hypothetical protein D068_cds05260 [Bacillus atrophaeus UCMB-5137]QUF66032.1 phage baseplate upper protein [Bacillus atrophaeus]QUF66085.1 phage baseplate upper protein [Bacillus atrophaeus]
MVYKNGGVSFDINAQRAAGRSTNIQFMTQDTGSAKLSFSFTKDGTPLPLSAVDAKIVLLYADGSFYKKSLTLTDKVNGTAEYVLSDEELKHYGQVKAELKLYYTNGQALATTFFNFAIAKTLEDQNIVPVADYYIDDFETLRAGVNATVVEISQTIEELRAKFADLEAIETKEGAQEKADVAEANARNHTDAHTTDKNNPHGVTKVQVGLSNVDNVKQASKKEFESHNSNHDIHITTEERAAWNAKETPEGSQEKVDAHATKADIHVTQSNKDKWNAGQLTKLTTDSGYTINVNAPNRISLSGFYGVANSSDMPDTKYYKLIHLSSSEGTATQIAIANGDGTIYSRVKVSDVWTSWQPYETTTGVQGKVGKTLNDAKSYTNNLEKRLTDLTWFSPILQNSWVNYTDVNASDQTKFKVRYAKDVTGTVFVEGAIAKGTIGFGIPAFVLPVGYRPSRAFQWVGVASQAGMSGVPQYHRLIVEIDGKVIIENCSNTINPNNYISLGFNFKAV